MTPTNLPAMKRPRWSVVIPAFNEAERLPRYLHEVLAFLGARGPSWEVVVVDDGSHDDTVGALKPVLRDHPAVRVVRHQKNSGKGFAVRAGMLAAGGQYRLFADADGATPIAELVRLEAALDAGADVAIGSRAVTAPDVRVQARHHRVAAGRIFNLLVASVGLGGIADSQCGFKAFTAAAAEDLFGRLETNGFGFDVEVLLRARRSGYRIAEVPVNWTDQEGSKVRLLRNGPVMVWEVLKARRRALAP
jgi:dolichyl-phosphate beta-glucosyltransferase